MSLFNNLFISTVAFIYVLNNVSAKEEISLRRSEEIEASCANRCNVDHKTIKAMMYTEVGANESDLKCFTLCWQNEAGFRKDGKVSLEGILKWVRVLWADHYEKGSEVARNCVQNIREGDDGDEALQLSKCLIKGAKTAGIN